MAETDLLSPEVEILECATNDARGLLTWHERYSTQHPETDTRLANGNDMVQWELPSGVSDAEEILFQNANYRDVITQITTSQLEDGKSVIRIHVVEIRRSDLHIEKAVWFIQLGSDGNALLAGRESQGGEDTMPLEFTLFMNSIAAVRVFERYIRLFEELEDGVAGEQTEAVSSFAGGDC